jgi:hypothetical protein
MLVLTASLAAMLGPAAGTAAASGLNSRVTIAIVPRGTTPAELAGIDHMAVGLLSAGIGRVPDAQTYLDIGQGSRLIPSLYDNELPLVYVAAPLDDGQVARVPSQQWARVRERAADAPADIEPGLLGQTLRQANVPVSAHQLPGEDPLALVDARGAIDVPGCGASLCTGVQVIDGDLDQVAAISEHLRPGDLLIAIERPPPDRDHALTAGIAGSGFRGQLTSDSTRIDGLVLSTDVAPTVLERLGIRVPDEMDGEPIRAEGAADPGAVESLGRRLSQVGPRRSPVIGISLLVWIGLTGLAGIVFGARGLGLSLRLLALTMAYLPALLLLTAALRPSQAVEQLVAGLGAPALAAATLVVVPGCGAIAVAAGVSVLAYAADIVAGGGLTEVSLIGPNPVFGVRFYGIGNELEAMAAAFVPIATGAGLAAWGRRLSDRAAALAFGLAALVAVIAFAPGRFGADVGAAIDIPIGAAVAAAVCLGGGWRRGAWVLAVPLLAVSALVIGDLTLGGDAHLTRSVLHAGGLDNLADVADRRLRLSAASFGRYASNPALWITALLIVLGIARRRRIAAWFGDRRAWAGFLGAVAATAVGTLANDSGALLLMIGTTLAALYAGFAWGLTVPASHRLRHEVSGRPASRGGLR